VIDRTEALEALNYFANQTIENIRKIDELKCRIATEALELIDGVLSELNASEATVSY
jgi:hypothetical protein